MQCVMRNQSAGARISNTVQYASSAENNTSVHCVTKSIEVPKRNGSDWGQKRVVLTEAMLLSSLALACTPERRTRGLLG